jgi:RecA/RadA recombinase
MGNFKLRRLDTKRMARQTPPACPAIYRAIHDLLHEGTIVAVIDVDHAFQVGSALSTAVNVRQLPLSQPDSTQQTLDTVKALLGAEVDVIMVCRAGVLVG